MTEEMDYLGERDHTARLETLKRMVPLMERGHYEAAAMELRRGFLWGKERVCGLHWWDIYYLLIWAGDWKKRSAA